MEAQLLRVGQLHGFARERGSAGSVPVGGTNPSTESSVRRPQDVGTVRQLRGDDGVPLGVVQVGPCGRASPSMAAIVDRRYVSPRASSAS